jgi:hypothetical protein
MSVSQKQKSIASLHEATRARLGVSNILEISSKSSEPLGVRLSAFNLLLPLETQRVSVEVAFQAGKRFERGGPFLDLLCGSSREAKGDPRLKESGRLIGFVLSGEAWPLEPRTAFYDWLYLNALDANPDLSEALAHYEAFTDIEFNPAKSLNCQAHSAALYVSLRREGLPRLQAPRSDLFERDLKDGGFRIGRPRGGGQEGGQPSAEDLLFHGVGFSFHRLTTSRASSR